MLSLEEEGANAEVSEGEGGRKGWTGRRRRAPLFKLSDTAHPLLRVLNDFGEEEGPRAQGYFVPSGFGQRSIIDDAGTFQVWW